MHEDDGFREIDIASEDRRDLGTGFWSSIESLCEDRENDATIDRIDYDRDGNPVRAVLSDKVRPKPIAGLRWTDAFACQCREHFRLRPSLIAALIEEPLLQTLRRIQDARELLAKGLLT